MQEQSQCSAKLIIHLCRGRRYTWNKAYAVAGGCDDPGEGSGQGVSWWLRGYSLQRGSNRPDERKESWRRFGPVAGVWGGEACAAKTGAEFQLDACARCAAVADVAATGVQDGNAQACGFRSRQGAMCGCFGCRHRRECNRTAKRAKQEESARVARGASWFRGRFRVFLHWPIRMYVFRWPSTKRLD
jgi:hypothetical protein